MRKRLFVVGLFLLSISMAFMSCSKNETATTPAPAESSKKIVYTYILDGVSYPVTMLQKNDTTFDVASGVVDTLAKVLDLPTSTLLKDPFTANTYFVFRSEADSKWKDTQIQQQLQSMSKKDTVNSKNKSYNYCRLIWYADRYFGGDSHTEDLFKPTWNDGTVIDGYSDLRKIGWNDRISSYQIYSGGGSRSYVIVFYQNLVINGRHDGHTLTAYGYEGYPTYGIHWQDANMHGTLMTGGIWDRKYWGDQVTAVKWAQIF